MKVSIKAFALVILLNTTPLLAEVDIPEGFSWIDTGPGESKFLKPDGWFVRTEEIKGTYGIFISKEKIEDSKQFQTGFSVNVIRNVDKKTGAPAEQYALAFISQANKTKEVVTPPWGLEAGPFKGYGIQVKDDVKVIHYMLVANTKTNTLFLTFYEAPPEEWQDAWKIGKVILNNMQLDDQV